MERFSYPNLAAVRAEECELLQLLELESYGEKYFEELEIERMQKEVEA